MSVFKIEKNKEYTIMSNYHLRDRNLSYKAKGLLSFMLSLPEDWDYSLKGLCAISKESRDGIRSILNELKDNNYLEIERVRNDKGLFEYNYLIYEKPINNERGNENCPDILYPDTDIPYMDSPSTEKPTQISTNIINTNNKIDKDDKQFKSSFFDCEEHNVLTIELIRNKYISEDDSQIFYYDKLFNQLLEENSYCDLITITNYICKRVINNNFKDEYGSSIDNKYGYFKNSMLSNINLLAGRKDNNELWSDEHIEELINMR